jgi:hypothetical protein
MRLSIDDGEKLLLAHWGHLRFSSFYVQTALYIGTPLLLQAAQNAIGECPQPGRLFEHLAVNYGIHFKDHPGLRHEAQLRALAPYLQLLSPEDIYTLWDACNDHGWFAIRRELLDSRLQPPFTRNCWSREAALEALDAMTGSQPPYPIENWIDRFLECVAFRILAIAIEHRGTRADLWALQHHSIAANYPGIEICADIAYAVRRRSIR